MKRSSTLARRTPLRSTAKKPKRLAAKCVRRGCTRPPARNLDMCLTHTKRECDRLFSLCVRSIGICVNCGAVSTLQCAHIVSRRYLTVRYDFGNAVPLCAKCHTYYTHRPLEWERWVDERIGADEHRALKEAALVATRLDWAAVLACLRARHNLLRDLSAEFNEVHRCRPTS